MAWHIRYGLFQCCDAKKRYQKPIWIVETAYGFTLENAEDKGEIFKPWVNAQLLSEENTYQPLPLTKEGQAEFVKELLRRGYLNGVDALIWWEPFWIPRKGLTWATIEGETYTKETYKPTNDEWANQCLFDYEGNATPAFYLYKI